MRSRLCLLIGLAALFALRDVVVAAESVDGSILELVEQGTPHNVTARRAPEGLTITDADGKEEGRLQTAKSFATPIVITLVARTDRDNVRLYFAKGEVFLSWETAPHQLLYHDPKTGKSSHVPDEGFVPANQWLTVRWTITQSESRVEVDGTTRARFAGDFRGLSGSVGVGTNHGSTVTIRSLTVSTGGGGPAAPPSAPAGGGSLAPVEVTVPSATPTGTADAQATATSAPAGDPDAIERPAFRVKPKRLAKSVTSVTSMMVRIADDGQAVGMTSDIIATVPEPSRAARKAGAGFYRVDGDDEMKTAFEEAVRAVTLRYPIWEPGHIDISFGEKFERHGGPSAGTAFGILMLSCLEGFSIDPKCAVTGDISVDWRVRKVGGVAAKLRGATLDKCLYAVIPEGNETAFADMALLYGDSALWDIQVFSASNLQQAVGVARTDRSPQIAEAMSLFADLQSKLSAGPEKLVLRNPATTQQFQRVLQLAPNHLSAKHVLALAEGTAPKTLSANATLYQLTVIFYPYRVILAQRGPINRLVLPAYVTAQAHKRLNALRPIANKDLQSLLTAISSFIEAMDGLANNTASLNSVMSRAENLDARFAALNDDPKFIEKLIREGY